MTNPHQKEIMNVVEILLIIDQPIIEESVREPKISYTESIFRSLAGRMKKLSIQSDMSDAISILKHGRLWSVFKPLQ